MRAFRYQSIYDQSANPPWDRLTGASDHRIEALANWTDGVYPDGGWETTPGVGMSVVVSPGMGRIRGIFCYDDDPHSGGLSTEGRTLIVQAADESLDRIDRVVVRHNDALNIRATDWYILKGTPSASPTPPELTRNSSTYELCVAEIFIARGTSAISAQRITDTRMDYKLCGITTTRVMDLAIDEIKKLLTSAIDETAAGNIRNSMAKMVVVKPDVRIYSASAVSDSTYTKYPFRIDIPIGMCTEEHVPDIYLNPETENLFYEICESRVGAVRVYVSKNDFGTVTIPVIRLTKESSV